MGGEKKYIPTFFSWDRYMNVVSREYQGHTSSSKLTYDSVFPSVGRCRKFIKLWEVSLDHAPIGVLGDVSIQPS